MIETTDDKLKFIKHKLLDSYILPIRISVYNNDKDGGLAARYCFRMLNNYTAVRAGLQTQAIYAELDLYPYELCLFDYRSYINVHYNVIVNSAATGDFRHVKALYGDIKPIKIAAYTIKELDEIIDEHIVLITKLQSDINLQKSINLVESIEYAEQ